MDKETKDYIDNKIRNTNDLFFGIIILMCTFVLEFALIDEKPEGIGFIIGWGSYVCFVIFSLWLIAKSVINRKTNKVKV